MLEYLRNASEKPLAKVLMGLLIFSFVGWGVAEWVFSGSASDTTLVEVGNTEIDVQQFNLEKSRQMATLSRDAQRAIYTDKDATAEFTNNIISKLATEQMAHNRAKDLGYVVTERKIAHEIKTLPEFQENGQFSPVLFDNILMNSGYNEAEFASILRGQVLRSMVMIPVSVSWQLPDFVVKAMYNARYAEHNVEYETVEFKTFKVASPTDDDLRTFYAQHPKIVPAVRFVSYVLVPGNLSAPDEYEKALAVAQSVEDDIIAGDSFADAAKKHDAKFVSVGAINADTKSDDAVMDDKMIARVFGMEEGDESELLETKQGFVMVRVDKIVPEHAAEYESVKKDLVDDWVRDEQKKLAYVRANEILVDLNNGIAMKNAKKAIVSRASGAPDAVLVAAFNSGTSVNSIVPGDNVFYVLHIDDTVMPKVEDKKMADLRKEMEQSAERNMTNDYNSFLKREYPVKVHEKVYDRYFRK